jgi:hypothetical protein
MLSVKWVNLHRYAGDLVQESLKLSETDDEEILEKARNRARERG